MTEKYFIVLLIYTHHIFLIHSSDDKHLDCFWISVSMVSVCLPSDALLQHLPSYLGLSYLGHGISLHDCSSKAQPMLLTLDEGYLLTAALPDLQRGIAPLGPPVPLQPQLGVGPPGHCPWPWA